MTNEESNFYYETLNIVLKVGTISDGQNLSYVTSKYCVGLVALFWFWKGITSPNQSSDVKSTNYHYVFLSSYNLFPHRSILLFVLHHKIDCFLAKPTRSQNVDILFLFLFLIYTFFFYFFSFFWQIEMWRDPFLLLHPAVFS